MLTLKVLAFITAFVLLVAVEVVLESGRMVQAIALKLFDWGVFK